MRRSVVDKTKALELLIELIEIPSAYFHEAPIMHRTKQRAKELGLPAELQLYYFEPLDFHGLNLYGEIVGGLPGPTLYLGGHLDTVNPVAGWTREPLQATKEGDRLYGTGALDMKAGCAAILMALSHFKQAHANFRGRIIYHFASVEEGPYGLGTTHFLKDSLTVKPDFAILTEPASQVGETTHPAIALGSKGGYNYTVHLKGKSAHAATPELGISAAEDAARLIPALNQIETLDHPVLGKAASCVISVHAGSGAASVPDEARVEVFRHVVPGETIETIRREVESVLTDLALRSQAKIRFRPSPAEGFDGGFAPYYYDETNVDIKRLIEVCRRVYAKEPIRTTSKAIGDFNLIGGLYAIPTVLVGASGGAIHQPDEYVELTSYYQLIELLIDFLETSLT